MGYLQFRFLPTSEVRWLTDGEIKKLMLLKYAVNQNNRSFKC